MPTLDSVYLKGGVVVALALALIAAPNTPALSAAATAVRVESASEPVDGAGVVGSTLSITAPTETTYGDFWSVTATLTVAEAAMVMGEPVTFQVDGRHVGTGYLVWNFQDGFFATVLFSVEVPAGVHQVTAHFAGADSTTPVATVAPATSPAAVVAVRQVETATTITSAPTSANVVDPITVSARVTADRHIPSGTMSLFAAGQEIAQAAVAADGTATFGGVRVPGAAADLVAVFNDPRTGNFARSASDPVPLEVAPLETSTLVTPAHVMGTTTHPATVGVRVVARDAARADVVVPGRVQAYVAGVAEGEPVSLVNGVAEVPLAGLPLGVHELELRYVPDAGYTSSSATIQVEITDDGMLPATGMSDAVLIGTAASVGAIALGAIVISRRRAEQSVER